MTWAPTTRARTRGALMAVAELSRATGRRKEAVARVRLVPGEGKFTINRSRSLEDYFPNLAVRMTILEPFRLVGREKAYDVFALLEGGGNTGQAGASATASPVPWSS